VRVPAEAVLAEWLFVGVIVVTAWWYLRVSRGQFLRDDWRVATRSLSFSDLDRTPLIGPPATRAGVG
jgi:hypothetical protein